MEDTIVIFIINLKSNPERKENIIQQLSKINFPHVVIEAVNGKAMSQEQLNSACDNKTLLKRYHRLLTPGEIGCSLSHKKVYEYMIKNEISKAIICEDDIIFNENFIQCYKSLQKLKGQNYLIKLDCEVKPETPTALFGKKKIDSIILKKNIFEFWNARGYYIDIGTAKKLLQKHPKVDAFADNWAFLAKDLKQRLCYPRCIDDNTTLASTLSQDRDIVSTQEKKQSLSIIQKIPRHIVFLLRKFCGYINPFH